MKKKILSIFLCTLLLATASSVAVNVDKNNMSGENCTKLTPRGSLFDPGDILYTHDVTTSTGDTQCLGVEFDGTYFWVTGRNDSEFHKLHKFDSDGNHIISFDQGTTSEWGWRDLAWDGEYLYGSDEDEFVKIDPADGSVVELLTKPAGLPVCRGIAIDTDNGHFFSANWGSPIYEFNPDDGTIYNTFPNTLSIYGLAYDDVSPGGPYLWVYSQDGVSPILVQISQFDINAGIYTGIIYQGFSVPGSEESWAGGCAFYGEGDIGIMVGLTQVHPEPDTVFGMHVTDLGAAPELEIGEVTGGLFKINAVIKNTGFADAADVEITINLNGGLILLGKTSSGIITSILAGGEETASSGLIFGIGRPVVTVTAEVPESSDTKDVDAVVLLVFIKI